MVIVPSPFLLDGDYDQAEFFKEGVDLLGHRSEPTFVSCVDK